MTDPLLVQRLAARLAEASEATPKGDGFWPALATIAAEESVKTIVVIQGAIPVDRFVGVVRHREGGWRQIAEGTGLVDLTTKITTYYEVGGRGDVAIMEIKRILILA